MDFRVLNIPYVLQAAKLNSVLGDAMKEMLIISNLGLGSVAFDKRGGNKRKI